MDWDALGLVGGSNPLSPEEVLNRAAGVII